jgi:hypothetical protein
MGLLPLHRLSLVEDKPVWLSPVQADPVWLSPVQADPVWLSPVQADPVQLALEWLRRGTARHGPALPPAVSDDPRAGTRRPEFRTEGP